MTERPKVTLRLSPDLKREFERKLQAGGWTKNSLLSKLIEDFVTSPTTPMNEPHGYSQATLTSTIIQNLRSELEFLSLVMKEQDHQLEQRLEQRLETIEQKLDSLCAILNGQSQPSQTQKSQLKIVP